MLLFLHGAGMDRTVWALVSRAFSHHGWSVLAPDLPGHGASQGPAPRSIEEYADWLLSLIDVSRWHEATLVGHSMGGLMALEAAAASARRIDALVLLGVADAMPVHPGLQTAADDRDHLAIDLVMGWSLSTHGSLGGHPTPGLAMLAAGTRMMERIDDGVLAGDLRACDRYSTALATASMVACRTLVVAAGADRMTRASRASSLAEALRDGSLMTLPATGHLMMVERPHQVIDTLRGFLERR